MSRNVLLIVGCLGMLLPSCGQSESEPSAKSTQPEVSAKPAPTAGTPTSSEKVSGATAKPRVIIETSMGTIQLELDRAKAPVTVENFLKYAKDGFYDGTIFHRVIADFMIQGGGLDEGMQKKQTRGPIQNEAKNGLKNKRGTIAMARTGAPHSATAQFFINVKDNVDLNYPARDGWGYCVFGQVVGGMDVVDKIRQVKTTSRAGRGDVPEEPVIIKSVKPS